MGLFHSSHKKNAPLPDSIKTPKAALAETLDASLPPLTGEHSAELLKNPNRGLRMEVYYTLGSGHAWPGDTEDGIEFLKKHIDFYQEDSPQAIQVYIYLCEYNKRELDETAFRQMKNYFTLIRDYGLSMELRYAYEFSTEKPRGPKNKMLLRHVEQLGEWMKKEADLIHDTVITYQFGMIGAWGEIHTSQHKHDFKKTFSAICGMVPPGTYLQARTMEHKLAVSGVPNDNMVGYHNDFMIGKAHEWNTAGAYQDSPWYQLFERTVNDTVNDGEMPWGRDTTQPIIDGGEMAQQCYEHHLTTLSMAHNYKEYRLNRSEAGKGPYNMERWQGEPVTADAIKKLGCPFYDSWFQDEKGLPMARSMFEYIRDFLGYQLMLSNLHVEDGEENSTLQVMVTNFGFAAPYQMEFARLAVKEGERWVEYPLEGFCGKNLKTYGQQQLFAALPFSLKGKRFGVRLGREVKTTGSARCVKTANNLPFEDGVNLLSREN